MESYSKWARVRLPMQSILRVQNQKTLSVAAAADAKLLLVCEGTCRESLSYTTSRRVFFLLPEQSRHRLRFD